MRIRLPHLRRATGALSLALLAAWPAAAPAQHTYTVPLVLAADGPGLEGFVRIANRSVESGTVQVVGVDDAGERFGPVALSLGAEAAVHLTSRDLERGSAAKGLPVGLGDGSGGWPAHRAGLRPRPRAAGAPRGERRVRDGQRVHAGGACRARAGLGPGAVSRARKAGRRLEEG